MGVYWKGVATTKDGCWDGGTGANALRIPLWGCMDQGYEHAKYRKNDKRTTRCWSGKKPPVHSLVCVLVGVLSSVWSVDWSRRSR